MNLINQKTKRMLASILASLIIAASLAACGEDAGTSTETDAPSQGAVSTAAETPAPVTEPETEPETTAPETAAPVIELPDDTEPPETEAPTTEAPAVTEAPTTEPPKTEPDKITTVGKFVNPLTGLPTEKDLSMQRPAAIMVNNEISSLPQEGISYADVIYESLTEGGITRLLMLISDYESLPKIGSVRSSRDYFLDFAQNHDAIYVHAGGSTYAYEQIRDRAINNLDGVNMPLPSGIYFRDAERLKTMRYEHTLMTNGKGISDGIAFKKYRTEVKQGFTNPFTFYGKDEKVVPTAGEAKHVIIRYTQSQFPQFIYNAADNRYYRYQYNGQAHMDSMTGEQLAFENVLILVCDHGSYNDSYGRITVDTTGSGKGYYVYGGKYMEIKWQKATRDSQITFTDASGAPLKINCGKTFVSIISPSVEDTLTLNYKR